MPSKHQMIAELRRLAAYLETSNLELGDDDVCNALLQLSLSFSPRIYGIERKLDRLFEPPSGFECRLSGADGDNVIQLMTGLGPTARAGAVEHLGECLDGAQHITICDPFFLQLPPKAMSIPDYVAALGSIFPEKMRSLELFVGSRKRTTGVADGINSLCKERSIRISCFKTDDIHDRVWIADYERAYSVGTSFNGLGNKGSFILQLPDEDKRRFIQEITARRQSLPKSKSV